MWASWPDHLISEASVSSSVWGTNGLPLMIPVALLGLLLVRMEECGGHDSSPLLPSLLLYQFCFYLKYLLRISCDFFFCGGGGTYLSQKYLKETRLSYLRSFCQFRKNNNMCYLEIPDWESKVWFPLDRPQCGHKEAGFTLSHFFNHKEEQKLSTFLSQKVFVFKSQRKLDILKYLVNYIL